MPKTTKELMAAYQRTLAENTLLRQYIADTIISKGKPDAVDGYVDDLFGVKVRMELWRATFASGGYVVTFFDNSSEFDIQRLDDLWRKARDGETTSVGARLAVERLYGARQEILTRRSR